MLGVNSAKQFGLDLANEETDRSYQVFELLGAAVFLRNCKDGGQIGDRAERKVAAIPRITPLQVTLPSRPRPNPGMPL